MEPRRIAIVVAVPDSVPRRYLGGAVNGARDFAEWTRHMGYTTSLILEDSPTPDAGPVTMARLTKEVMAALNLPDGGPIERLIVYFAGHGLIRDAEENLWLVSDTFSELRAVDVELLKRRLIRFGIEQIVLIGDACSSLPADMTAADLTADVPVSKAPANATGDEEVDRFLAAQDGLVAYSVPGEDPGEDRCIFTGVLLEALSGTAPTAFSQYRSDVVTSQSLASFLRKEVPERALFYGKRFKPSVTPTFSEGRDVYFDRNANPPPPAPGPWPLPPHPVILTKSAPPPGGFGRARGSTPDFLGPVSSFEIDLDRPKRRSPADIAADALLDPLGGWLKNDITEDFEGYGLLVSGQPVQAVWSDKRLQSFQPRADEVTGFRFNGIASTLVQFETGDAAGLVTMPGLVTRGLKTFQGLSAVSCAPVWQGTNASPALAIALRKMDETGLRAAEVTDLTVELRRTKHTDPVLGVISAYLYAAIDDLDSIRRMAYFYIQHHQPIPYDIALLAGLEKDGPRGVFVPAVREREPRSEAEQRASWAWQSTPQTSGMVAGLWPWMRQGWSWLEDADDLPHAFVAPGLSDLAKYLTPGRFTTIRAEGIELLAECLGLKKQPFSRAGEDEEGELAPS